MQHLSILLAALVSALLVACGSTSPGQELRQGLPAYAGVVQLESELDAARLAARVREQLEGIGFRCSGSTLIRTEPLMLGTLWTRARVEVSGSTATAGAEWAVPGGDELLWRVARNAEGSGDDVFLALCRAMAAIPHRGITYRFE